MLSLFTVRNFEKINVRKYLQNTASLQLGRVADEKPPEK